MNSYITYLSGIDYRDFEGRMNASRRDSNAELMLNKICQKLEPEIGKGNVEAFISLNGYVSPPDPIGTVARIGVYMAWRGQITRLQFQAAKLEAIIGRHPLSSG